jgi:hypothetical protein
MGHNADEISRWLGAIHELEAALIAAGVEEYPEEEGDCHSFIFEDLLEVIGVDTGALPIGWENWGILDIDESDRYVVHDLGELFAEFPGLLTSAHPAIVAYRQALNSINVDRQIREALEGE